MNELTLYGICLVLTVVLLIFGRLLVGRNFELPFLLLPLVLAMLVMGEKVSIFSPNGGRVKPFTNVLGILFAILLVPLLAGVLYGLYALASGGVHWLTAAEGVGRTGPPSATAAALLRINGVLWGLTALLAGLLLVNAARSLRWLVRMTPAMLLVGYVVPLLVDGLAFFLLLVTRRYLLDSPGGAYAPDLPTKVAVVVLVNHLVFVQARNVIHFATLLRPGPTGLGWELRIIRLAGLAHAVLFGYYLARLFFFP
ncbi:MAG: hypothetical protein ICV83_02520 [Cytophagales bacterium]|nr:hypothetical protein [Cytophagales bacterium]